MIGDFNEKFLIVRQFHPLKKASDSLDHNRLWALKRPYGISGTDPETVLTIDM